MSKKIDVKSILSQMKNVPTDDGFLKSFRERLTNYIKTMPPIVRISSEERLIFKRSNNLIYKFKTMPIALIIGLIIALTGGGTAAASQNSLPGDILYPVKLFTEDTRTAVAFNSDSKARLQIKFAAERIDEIKAILKEKGVEVEGLEIARTALENNLARTASIIEGEKIKGRDISALAKELNDNFVSEKGTLKQAFKDKKEIFKTQEEELKAKIKEARKIGDIAQVEQLIKQLNEVKLQRNLLEQKEEEQEEMLEDEEDRLEEVMEKRAEAEKVIREAEKEKQEVVAEALKEGVNLPQNAFEKFDRLLAQAKELFSRENYQGAKQLAKQAEKSLDKVEDIIDELEDLKEKDEDEDENEDEGENNNRGRGKNATSTISQNATSTKRIENKDKSENKEKAGESDEDNND